MTDYATPFLAALGAPTTDSMRLAVAAWQTQESGGRVTGNNPWNLHIGPACSATAGEGVKGYRPSQALRSSIPGLLGNRYAGRGDQNVAVFASPGHGAEAAARNLLRADGATYGYDKVVATARTGNPVAFLNALAASSWSAGRYGTRNGGPNALLAIYHRLAPAAPSKEAPVQITTRTFDPTLGATPPGTRRFAAVAPFEEYDVLEESGHYLFDAEVRINNAARTPHGTFLRTATRPPFLVPGTAVTWDPAGGLPHPAAITNPPAASPTTSSSAFVGAFGATPDVIWQRTLAAIIAAGEYTKNTDGEWMALSIAQWRALALAHGGDAAVAAYDVQVGVPGTAGTGDSAFPSDMTANVDRYFCGVFGRDGMYYAYRDGKLLATQTGGGTFDTAAWGQSLGLNPSSWY